MFFRTKTSGPRTYLQVVENRWEGGRSRQRVIATLGRLDDLQRSGQLEAPLISGARLAESVLILTDHAQGKLPDFRGHHTHLGADFRMLLCMSSSSVSSSSGGVRPDASGQR